MSKISPITAEFMLDKPKLTDIDYPLRLYLTKVLALRTADQNTDFAAMYHLTSTSTLSSPSVGTVYKLLELIADKFGNQYILKPAILFSLDRTRFTCTERESIHDKIARAHCAFSDDSSTPRNEEQCREFFSCIDMPIPLDIVHSELFFSDIQLRYEETTKMLDALRPKYEEYVREILHLKSQGPTLKAQLRKCSENARSDSNLSDEEIEEWKFIIETGQAHETRMIAVYRSMKAIRHQIHTYQAMTLYWDETLRSFQALELPR